MKKGRDKRKSPETLTQGQAARLKPPEAGSCIMCFKPQIDDLSFEGSEIFKMSLSDDTKDITMNAVEIVITKAIWEEDVTQNRQEPSEIKANLNGTLSLVFEPTLMPQTGCLRLNFKGSMSDRKVGGFYVYNTLPAMPEEARESIHALLLHPTSNNKKKLNLMAVWPPCEARKCFPCWDDPAFKMTYDIILVVPKDAVAIGPTLVKARYDHKRNPLLEVVEFKTTPKLSTPSISFAYGTFECVERKTPDDELLVRVYTPPGMSKDAHFALSLAGQAMTFFGAYFGVRLNIQKIDLVAVPDQISAPISCWGLIYYRTADIIVEPQTAVLDLMWISLIVCHELIKQWFGCHVTFEWWTHQWMKEGFAAFAKYIFVNTMFPEIDVWSHFTTHMFQKALIVDGFRSPHPVEFPVVTPTEIEEAVDEICMYKAPSLLRMLHRYLGDENFRNALELFLIRHGESAATAVEFWKCFQEVSSKPIVSMMMNWTTTRGYPIIDITAKYEGKICYMKLHQERFAYDLIHRDSKSKSQLWAIPLSFSTRYHPQTSVLDIVMDGRNLSISLPGIGKNDWIKVNPGSAGFYRVRYPQDMYSQLVYGIREKSLPSVDRANFLDDYFAFLQVGYITTVEMLSLLEIFTEDEDYAVWFTISRIFDKFLNVFETVGKVESFQGFGRYIYQTIYFKLGWTANNDENVQKKILRGLILRMMAKFKDPDVVDRCKSIFDAQFGDEPLQIPIDIRYAVYKTAVMYGDDQLLKKVVRLYRDSDSVEERDKYAYAIGASKNEPQIEYALNFCLSDEVRPAHALFIITSMSKTKLGRETAWAFFKENVSAFRLKFDPRHASKLLQVLLEDFSSEEKLTEIQEFFKSNPFSGTERILHQIAESIKLNEAWLRREKNLSALQDYLDSL